MENFIFCVVWSQLSEIRRSCESKLQKSDFILLAFGLQKLWFEYTLSSSAGDLKSSDLI